MLVHRKLFFELLIRKFGNNEGNHYLRMIMNTFYSPNNYHCEYQSHDKSIY